METASLPPKSNPKEVAAAVDAARRAAWFNRNTYLTWCQIAYSYLKGYRRFKVTSLEDARVLVGYEGDMGELRLRNEDIREKFKVGVGRFLRMDLSPEVTKRSWGLDSIRKASIGQVALNHELRFADLKELQSTFIEMIFLYGTAGIAHWTYRDMDGRSQNEIEIIPGWEILPLPAFPTHNRNIQGMQRYRKVPLKWLEKMDGISLPDSHREAVLETENINFGAHPNSDGLSTSGDSGMLGSGAFNTRDSAGATDGSSKSSEVYVPLLETWIRGPENTVARYIAKVGKHIAGDVDYTEGENKRRVPMPISTARYIPDTSFYSYGFVMMLMSGNHQEEKMLQNLFRNVEELDQYGTVMWPLTAGAGKKEFDKKNGRPKCVGYEPDYTVPDAKPFTLQPANTGDFPGRVAMLAAERQDKLAGQGPLFQGQSMGRVDSAAGLGFTFEVSQIAQAATAHEIANAWSQIYKSMLYSIKENFEEGQMLSVTNIDDNVAGIKINEKGEASIDDNPIPDYWEVKIDVRDREPRSKEAQKQELVSMLELEIIDEVDFRIENWKQDLGFPVGNRAEFEAYRKAVYNNIVLFGDGEEPGTIHQDIFMDNPEIHLRAVTAFTARLEMSFASQGVRQAFTNQLQLLKAMLGEYPSGMPPMEDLAAQQMGLMKGAGGMGGMGGNVPTAQPGPIEGMPPGGGGMMEEVMGMMGG